MTIIERIKEFIKAQGLNNSAFEKRAGLGNGYISKVKGSPSPEKCEDILKAFPELSRDWLFTGRGEMLQAPAGSAEPEPSAEAAPLEDPAGFVSIPAEAWNVIKQQAASLERKDRQVDRVISLLEAALNEKGIISAAAPSGPFAPSGMGGGLNAGTKHP